MACAITVLFASLGPACAADAPAKGNADPLKDMVLVKGGCFMMGCGIWMSDCRTNEKPEHEVCIGDFYMDKYEVIQKDFSLEIDNPSFFVDDNFPVDSVTWYEAKDYCEKKGKRLPTEAEWEYAARNRGQPEVWAGISNKEFLNEYAWYSRFAGDVGRSHTVGEKLSNELGLYDMTGNVWEWVGDRYAATYYKKSPKVNPKGPNEGEMRVLRGGSWYYRDVMVRTTYRHGELPDTRQDDFGFRCARDK